jgi:hypothetical protein
VGAVDRNVIRLTVTTREIVPPLFSVRCGRGATSVSCRHDDPPSLEQKLSQGAGSAFVKTSTGKISLSARKDFPPWHVPRNKPDHLPMAPSSRTLARGPGIKPSAPASETRRSSVGSWMGLLAATTLGVPGASTVRAEVRADMTLSEGRPYRLVVQSYDESVGGDLPSGRAKPRASIQRPITAGELRDGVQVDLLELGQADVSSDGAPRSLLRSSSVVVDDAARGNLAKALVLAWVEEGRADLEFDGRRARPMPGSFVGAARRERTQGKVRIDVKPLVAA